MPSASDDSCKCPYSCSRHGDCRACVEHHRKSGSKTSCGKDGKAPESAQEQA